MLGAEWEVRSGVLGADWLVGKMSWSVSGNWNCVYDDVWKEMEVEEFFYYCSWRKEIVSGFAKWHVKSGLCRFWSRHAVPLGERHSQVMR